MKYLLIFSLLIVSCGNVPEYKTTPPTDYTVRESYSFYEKGMEYKVYKNGYGMQIVNHTKDSLECEYYKSNISKQ